MWNFFSLQGSLLNKERENASKEAPQKTPDQPYNPAQTEYTLFTKQNKTQLIENRTELVGD